MQEKHSAAENYMPIKCKEAFLMNELTMKVMEAMRKNGFEVYETQTAGQARAKVLEQIGDKGSVGVGGCGTGSGTDELAT